MWQYTFKLYFHKHIYKFELYKDNLLRDNSEFAVLAKYLHASSDRQTLYENPYLYLNFANRKQCIEEKTLLAETGANSIRVIILCERHGGWKSDLAESYIKESARIILEKDYTSLSHN